MSLESQLNLQKTIYKKINPMAASEFKTQFVKINKNTKNQIRKGYGHSQMKTNNFSRRNSIATITDSSNFPTNSSKSVRTPAAITVDMLSPTTTTMTNNSIVNKHYNINKLMQSQQSWSMSNLKNYEQVVGCCASEKIKRNNYEFTEQRCNYERMTQQQLQRPWSSEQVIRCNVSNSRIPTCTIDQNQHQHNFNFNTTMICNAIDAEFLALNEFRMQNSKDCFSERHYRLLQLRAQTPPNNSSISSDISSSLPGDYEINLWFNNHDDTNRCRKQLKNNENVTKSKFSLSLTPMPYVVRQRLLKEQLEKESLCRKSNILDINKSTALSYQANH